MTLTWAIELGKYGITVNAMAPAAVTRMTTGLLTADPEQDPAGDGPGEQRADDRVPRQRGRRRT